MFTRRKSVGDTDADGKNSTKSETTEKQSKTERTKSYLKSQKG